MRIWDKIQGQERDLPAAYAMGVIANGLAVSLERATAPIVKRPPQQHVDDGCVPIRFANGDIIRMKPLRAAAVVKNGLAVFMQEIEQVEPIATQATAAKPKRNRSSKR